jgi:ABC-type bacteriocin/lantibiotic exporter with double-glycine peptidase domain
VALTKHVEEKTTTNIPSLKEMLRYIARLIVLVRGHWRGFAEVLCLSTIIGTVGMAVPYASKLLIDNVYPARDVGLMHVVVIGVLVLTASTSLMGAVQGYFSQVVSGRLGSAASLMFFNQLQHLRAPFFDSHQVGEIMSRFSDVRAALGIVTGAFQTLVTSTVFLLLVPPFLLVLSWRLALLSILMVPVTTVITTLSSRYVRRYFKLNAEAGAALTAYQYEVFSHIRSLKTMALEYQIFDRVSRETHQVLETSLRAARVQNAVNFANGLLRAFGTGLFTWFAWTLILSGDLTLGAFVAFTGYLGYLTGPVARLAALFGSFQQSAVALGRMFEYMDLPLEQDPTSCYRQPPVIRTRSCGDIGFRDVSFAYEGARSTLEGVTVTLPRECMTAIVGPSGSGKSTLLRLVPRLIEATRGVVTLDGVDLRAIPISELRRQVATVWQEPFVMRGTFRENLLLGNADAKQSTVDAAIDTCQLTELVESLPAGLDTPIAEWGATLSGGQRQRLSIARALIRETPILLLDEAMANIDSETEESIIASLRMRYPHQTVVLVTHRLASAACADHVCVVEGGRVVGMGSALELSVSSPAYARMLASAGSPVGVGGRSRR